MSQRKYNSIQLMFNAENKPYLYGAIHIVDGDIDNQWWEPTRPNPGPSRDASASAGPSLQQDSLVGAWPWVESRRKDTTVRAPSGQSQRKSPSMIRSCLSRLHRQGPHCCSARIVAEMREAGATVAGVARRYGLNANELSGWRGPARNGRLVLLAADADVEFAPLVVRAKGFCAPCRAVSAWKWFWPGLWSTGGGVNPMPNNTVWTQQRRR